MNQTYTMEKAQELIPIEKSGRWEKFACHNRQISNIYRAYKFQNQNSKQKSGTHISNVYIFGQGYIHEFV